MGAIDIILNCGYTKPLFRAEMEDREEISRTIALHYTLLQSKAEMDQLKQGLNSLGVADLMKEQVHLFANFFTSDGHSRLTAGQSSLKL